MPVPIPAVPLLYDCDREKGVSWALLSLQSLLLRGITFLPMYTNILPRPPSTDAEGAGRILNG